MQQIYYVDEQDRPTGETEDKLVAHHSATKLHAAFSCYVFNTEGKFLVTQRAKRKKVWPGVWTNSCCGHPEPGENREAAIVRRMQEELGMTVDNIQLILPNYVYKTPPYKGIIEHEYCPLYVAITKDKPTPNPDEVEDYKWVSWDKFVHEASKDRNDYSILDTDKAPKWSWWCKDQLKHLARSDDFRMFLEYFRIRN